MSQNAIQTPRADAAAGPGLPQRARGLHFQRGRQRRVTAEPSRPCSQLLPSVSIPLDASVGNVVVFSEGGDVFHGQRQLHPVPVEARGPRVHRLEESGRFGII